MNAMSRCVVVGVVLAVALAAIPVLAAGSAVDQSRQIYEQKLLALEDDFYSKMLSLPKKYMISLTTLENRHKKGGNLDAVVACTNEAARFTTAKDVSVDDVVDSPASLRELQIKYLFHSITCRTQNHEDTIAVTRAYLGLLSKLEKDLTRKNNIRDAMAVRKERERTEKSTLLKRAEYELAELEYEKRRLDELLGGNSSSGDPSETVVSSSEPEESGTAEWDYVGGDGVTIYESGNVAPKEGGYDYKRASGLTATDEGRGMNTLSAEIMTIEREVGIGGRNVRTSTALRLTFWSRTADATIAKPTVMVEYFVKPYSGKANINRMREDIIRVPNIVGREKLTLDTRPIETTVYERREGRGRNNWVKQGTKFHGAAVSVFDENEKLIYQTVFPSSLKNEASSALP
jgi:hypothetical protein